MESNENSRRSFIKNTAAAIALTAIGGSALSKGLTKDADPMEGSASSFMLPPLPYAYDALEPHIDKQTMELHHTKHHQAYINNLNKAMEGMKESNIDIAALCNTIDTNTSAVIRNNAGGHYNHSLFWTLMTPNGKALPKGTLADAINTSFGSMANFKEKFSAAAMGRFGSGWAWLIANKGKLEIINTPNQDNPLMPVNGVKGSPVLALDVWEHAYYLKYQNRRAEYITAWWNIVNWENAEVLFKDAK